MTRFAVPLCLAVLASGCADALTAPMAAAPRPESDLAAILQGRAAGVRVVQTGETGGVIRLCRLGGRPLSPEERPLVIVDGVRRELVLREIDPAEIVDVEILKGPAATRRYGPDARHGAILVRTRSAAPAAGP